MKEDKKPIFTKEEIAAYAELGEILRRIHNRLVAEGVDIEKKIREYDQKMCDWRN